MNKFFQTVGKIGGSLLHFMKWTFGIPALYMSLYFINVALPPFLGGPYDGGVLFIATLVIFFTWRYWAKYLGQFYKFVIISGIVTYFVSTGMDYKLNRPLTTGDHFVVFGATFLTCLLVLIFKDKLSAKVESTVRNVPFFKRFHLWKQKRSSTEPCPVEITLEEVDRFGEGNAQMKGRIFEEYIAQVYQYMGYNAETTTNLRRRGALPQSIQNQGGSGEQGVDVLVETMGPNGQINFMAVQCKHYSNTVGNKAVQEIVTALKMYGATKGVVITNNYFTKQAKELAKVNGVTLIDRDGLKQMIEDASNYYYANSQKKNSIAG